MFLDDYFSLVKKLRPSFKPKYVSLIIQQVYDAAVKRIMKEKVTTFKGSEDPFVKALCLAVY